MMVLRFRQLFIFLLACYGGYCFYFLHAVQYLHAERAEVEDTVEVGMNYAQRPLAVKETFVLNPMQDLRPFFSAGMLKLPRGSVPRRMHLFTNDFNLPAVYVWTREEELPYQFIVEMPADHEYSYSKIASR